MGDIAIRAENLGKAYQITHTSIQGGYRTLQEDILHLLKRPFNRGNGASSRETFWALKDVSFEVRHGEVLGIIGRNGAGKSTLLKILSRITKPTTGRADIYGRVGSLLEVGTGFHQELTGRENIFLNGAVLGMSRRDIQKRFDEIVAFAGVEQFLDTPTKRYSSGMYMRLAFAVAAHLEPEVLIIDEVLAVGDAEFQKKCLGKMGEVAKSGRTVLFVSHNMAAVQQLCEKCILLRNGLIQIQDETELVVSKYLNSDRHDTHQRVELKPAESDVASGPPRFEWVELRDAHDQLCREFSIGDTLAVTFSIRLPPDTPELRLAVELRTADGIALANMIDVDSGYRVRRNSGQEIISVILEDIRFYPGLYYIGLWIGTLRGGETFEYLRDVATFQVIGGGRLTMRSLPRNAGLLFLTPKWVEREQVDERG